jgi:exopolysaccharide biosynthesis polyprenyl glycosylphosphotransferase
VAKRGFDLVVALLLLVVLSPALLMIALLVRVSSPGPILFRQLRVGKDGHPFWMFKFRTMFVDNDPAVHQAYYRALINGHAEKNAQGYKLERDPRVTRVGHLLRRTSADELPQLFNVLIGDMSLVGPRPCLPYEVELYPPHAWERLLVKPGMTGLWQVNGRNLLDFAQMVELDVEYIRHWSFWLDLEILVRTPLVVLTGRGAS